MKKRFMLVAVLLGSLALASCVDDKESDSVTALRNAMTEQIKSKVTLNNAEAEYRLAYAAYQNAQAAVQQAAADAANLANEKTKATLEKDIETAKVKAEAALVAAQVAYEQSKADLVAAMDKEAFAEAKRVKDLLTEADAAYNVLKQARQDKIDAEANILKLQYELESAQAIAANAIIASKQTIAENEALKAEYEKLVSSDKEEALAAAQAATAKATELQNIYQDKDKLYSDASQARQEVGNQLSGNRYYQLVSGGSVNQYIKKTEDIIEGLQYGYLTKEFNNEDGTSSEVNVDTEYWDPSSSSWCHFYNYVIDEQKLEEAIAAEQHNVTLNTLKVTEANKALADKKAEQTYKDLEKAVTDAQKAYDDATTATDKASKWADLTRAKAVLAAETDPLERAIETAQSALKTAQENLADAQELKELLTGEDAAAYGTLVASYVEALTAELDAEVEKKKANHNFRVQNSLASNLSNLANNLTDYETLINTCDQAIADANAAIVNQTNVKTKEDAIKVQEEKLEKAENQIAVYEPIYNAYVEKINAILAGEGEE